MHDNPHQERKQFCEMSRERLESHQLLRLNGLLSRVMTEQPFYAKRLSHLKWPLESLAQLHDFPLLNKVDLLPGIPVTICGLPRERYVRAHQTVAPQELRYSYSIRMMIGNGGSIRGSMCLMQPRSLEVTLPS